MVNLVDDPALLNSLDLLSTKVASNNLSPSPMKKRTAVRQPSGLTMKPKSMTAAADTPFTSQLDGDLSEDPIAQSVVCRVQLGGLNANTTDADAKKNSYPVFKAGKHPALKGTALLDIAAPPKADAVAASPSLRPAKARGLKPPTKIKGPTATGLKKVGGEQVDASGPAVSPDDDPIGAALKSRIASGGLNNQIKEADAKK